VPVAFEVAKSLRIPLDVFVVRKLGVPGHEELAMGAIASGGIRVLNDAVIRSDAYFGGGHRCRNRKRAKLNWNGANLPTEDTALSQ